jgi:hypothetical protein
MMMRLSEVAELRDAKLATGPRDARQRAQIIHGKGRGD